MNLQVVTANLGDLRGSLTQMGLTLWRREYARRSTTCFLWGQSWRVGAVYRILLALLISMRNSPSKSKPSGGKRLPSCQLMEHPTPAPSLASHQQSTAVPRDTTAVVEDAEQAAGKAVEEAAEKLPREKSFPALFSSLQEGALPKVLTHQTRGSFPDVSARFDGEQFLLSQRSLTTEKLSKALEVDAREHRFVGDGPTAGKRSDGGGPQEEGDRPEAAPEAAEADEPGEEEHAVAAESAEQAEEGRAGVGAPARAARIEEPARGGEVGRGPAGAQPRPCYQRARSRGAAGRCGWTRQATLR